MTHSDHSAELPATAANAMAAHHHSELSGFDQISTDLLVGLVHIGETLKAAQNAPHVQEILADGRRAAAAGYAGIALGSLESHGSILAAAQELQEDTAEPQSPPQT